MERIDEVHGRKHTLRPLHTASGIRVLAGLRLPVQEVAKHAATRLLTFGHDVPRPLAHRHVSMADRRPDRLVVTSHHEVYIPFIRWQIRPGKR